MRRGLGTAALALCGLLAGCGDDAFITHVSSSAAMTEGRLRTMALRGGLATEIHGAPWPGATPKDVAAALRLPNAFPPEMRFRAIPRTRVSPSEPSKLVLIFNTALPQDPAHACEEVDDLPALGPREQGFDVFAVFCGRNGWIGHGMIATKRWESGDQQEFTRLMRRLFKRILDEPNR